MKTNFTVTVIIPTFKRLDMLSKALAGVYSIRKKPEQVVVVYRPEDDKETAKWLQNLNSSLYPNLILQSVFVPGQVAAMNAGLKASTNDIVVILDDDAIPKPDWLDIILEHFGNPEVAAVGGRDIVHPHPQVKEQIKAGYIDYWGNIIGNHHLVVGPAREVDALKGCNWALRRSALGTLHFDERLLGKGAQPGNDYWLCLNLRHFGWKIILEPSAIVDHYPAVRLDHARDVWSKSKCFEQTRNEVAGRLAFYPWHLKLRFILFHIFMGHRNCPGIYFIVHSLIKRPKSLIAQFTGGWAGFFAGWRAAKEFRENPPGIPALPPAKK